MFSGGNFPAENFLGSFLPGVFFPGDIFLGTEIKTWAMKNLFPLDFAIYLSYSEVQRNRKVDTIWIRFEQVRNLF